MVDSESTRDAYGVMLTQIARSNRDVVALDCDLGRSTRSYRICEVDPERFIEMGIAEQDMISTAAGMASAGKTVFANSFAVFITGRAFDQIRQQVALPRSNVKVCGSSAGITQGTDGATHQSVLDVALMRCLPNMMVVVPADGNQVERVMHELCARKEPAYLRLSRHVTGNFLPLELPYELGKAQVLRQGEHVLLVSCGPILKNVLCAAEILEGRGISTGVANFHTLKPFDNEMLVRLAESYKLLVSVEEHSVYGGLGSAISEVLSEHGPRRRSPGFVRHGVRDCFGESGTAEELLKKHALDPAGIAGIVTEQFLKIDNTQGQQ